MSLCEPVFSTVRDRPFVLVFANEKGGTGKSTLAFHTVISLLQCGYSVGCIDADIRQSTLSRYIENRESTALQATDRLLLPRHVRLSEELADPAGSAVDDPEMVVRARDMLAVKSVIVRVPNLLFPQPRSSKVSFPSPPVTVSTPP